MARAIFNFTLWLLSMSNYSPMVLPSQETACDGYEHLRTYLQETFQEIWETSVKCIYISEAYRTTFILWSFLSHLKDHLHYAPLLIIDAEDKGCGKSTLQQFLAVLSGCPVDDRWTDFTKAGLKKLGNNSTIFLDEIDSITKTDLNHVTNYLNTSFEANGAQSINARSSSSSFGFRCISGINSFNTLKPATQSRCIRLVLERTPSNLRLEKKFESLNLGHLFDLSDEVRKVLQENAKKIRYYFTYVKYPQQAVLINRFGDVWKNMFDLATLIGEKYVNDLMTCVSNQPLDQPVLFPDLQYNVHVRQYNEPEKIEFYDGKDRVCTDRSTKDFITAIQAIMIHYYAKSKIGVHTKELFRLIKLLGIDGLPETQQTLGRYMGKLGFKNNKNVNKNSGYRFDETYETIATKYSDAVDDALLESYSNILEAN